jgi:hypothetical protein
MADRYWVGGGGNINDTAHWSLYSNGAGGEVIPTSSDNVYFDAYSGTGIVTVTAGMTCNNLDVSAMASGLSFSGVGTLSFYGTSLTWKSGVAVPFNVYCYGAALANLDLKGQTANSLTAQQDLTILSDVVLTGDILVKTGYTVNLNSYNLTASSIITTTGTSDGTLNMGSGTITFSSSVPIFGNYATINGNTSNLICTSNTTVTLRASSKHIFNNVSVPNAYQVTVNTETCTLNTLTVKDGGCVIKLTSGTTVNVSNLYMDGVSSKNTLQATSSGSQATLNLVSGVKTLTNVNIKDIAATPSSTWTATDSVDQGNNTGVTFTTSYSASSLFFGSNF